MVPCGDISVRATVTPVVALGGDAQHGGPHTHHTMAGLTSDCLYQGKNMTQLL